MSSTTEKSKIFVSAVRAMRDNYIWLIGNSTHTIVVDPGDATTLLTKLKNRKQSVCAILLTHKHLDHTAGVAALVKKYNVPVYASQKEGISQATVNVNDSDTITIPELDNLEIKIIAVPGHTQGHIAFYVEKYKWLFCGDALFGAGCGRLTEGTAEQLFDSLAKIAQLPDDTQVYCGHEYTLANLRFAQQIEPENTDITDRMKQDAITIRSGKPSLPSTIALEKKTNPFLRAHIASVAQRLKQLDRLNGDTSLDCFTALRLWKDTFVG